MLVCRIAIYSRQTINFNECWYIGALANQIKSCSGGHSRLGRQDCQLISCLWEQLRIGCKLDRPRPMSIKPTPSHASSIYFQSLHVPRAFKLVRQLGLCVKRKSDCRTFVQTMQVGPKNEVHTWKPWNCFVRLPRCLVVKNVPRAVALYVTPLSSLTKHMTVHDDNPGYIARFKAAALDDFKVRMTGKKGIELIRIETALRPRYQSLQCLWEEARCQIWTAIRQRPSAAIETEHPPIVIVIVQIC